MTAAALLIAAIFPARKARSLQSPLWLTAAYALLWGAACAALAGRLP
jgi:hypothetical protein